MTHRATSAVDVPCTGPRRCPQVVYRPEQELVAPSADVEPRRRRDGDLPRATHGPALPVQLAAGRHGQVPEYINHVGFNITDIESSSNIVKNSSFYSGSGGW